MEFVHRFYKLHNLLKSHRHPISRRAIELRLECAPATAKRVIRELRGYGAPIESVRGQGYRYAAGVAFELPGLWFSPSELVSLLVAQRLLADAEPGLLADEALGRDCALGASIMGSIEIGHCHAPAFDQREHNGFEMLADASACHPQHSNPP